MSKDRIYNTVCGNPTCASIKDRMDRAYFLTAAIEMLSEAVIDAPYRKLAGYDAEDMLNTIQGIAWELQSEITSVANAFDEMHKVSASA